MKWHNSFYSVSYISRQHKVFINDGALVMRGKGLKYTLCGILITISIHAMAQPGMTDTTSALPPVEIQSTRLTNYHSGYNIHRIDSISMLQYGQSSLSDLLSNNGLVYIKKYGINGIGSVSLRGTSAVHTATVWNGFNLQSPMNGGADLSLFPVGFADHISLQTGGSCALFGSGAIGGSIHINNTPMFGSGLHASVSGSLGSFAWYDGNMAVTMGTKKTFTSVKAFYHQAANHFKYKLNGTGITDTMKNSGLTEYGILVGHQIALGKYQLLALNFWWQESQREIPVVLAADLGASGQDDRILRGSVEWKYMKSRVQLSIRSLLNSENQHYYKELTSIDSKNNFLNSITEAEVNIALGKLNMLNAGLNNSFEQVHSNNYAAVTSRDRGSLYISHAFHSRNNKLKTSLALREEIGAQTLWPACSGGLEVALFKGSTLHCSGSSVYRIPTMNDLFWNPGGNSDLKAEEGWTVESGLKQAFRHKGLTMEVALTLYSYKVNNWIVWLPSASIWTPQNIQKVWSRGIESEFSLNYQIKKLSIYAQAQYSYTRSTNQQAKFVGDASVGKQLLYTPEHRAAGGVRISYHNFALSYNHQYTGIRYTSSDNLEWLSAFHTGDLQLSKRISLTSIDLTTTLSLDNIWNQQYQAIAMIPMPGRSYKTSITFQFNKPLKNQIK